MGTKPVNLSDEAKALLEKEPTTDVLEVTPGKHITKHRSLSWEKVSTEAAARHKYENEVTQISYKLPGHKLDTPVCAVRWLKKHFGDIEFGASRAFAIGPDGKTEDVPNDAFNIPGTTIVMKIDYGSSAAPQVTFQHRGKDRHIIQHIVDGIKAEQKANSVFYGKAISLDRDKFVFFDPGVAPIELIFSNHVQRRLDLHVFAKLFERDLLRIRNLPLKTGILLFGPPGNGKTAISQRLAQICIGKNYTFVYCKTPHSYEFLLNIVVEYRNVVILLEDVDQMTGQEYIDKFTNWLDAVDSKSMDSMFLFTTNYPEIVHEKMPKLFRKGRLDDVIHLDNPQERERERLFRLYLSNGIDGDFKEALDLTDNCNASSIRGIADTARLFSATTGNPEDIPIPAELVIDAAKSNRDYKEAVKSFERKLPPPPLDTHMRKMMRQEAHMALHEHTDGDHDMEADD